MGLCSISNERDFEISLCDTCIRYIVGCHRVFMLPRVPQFPLHVINTRVCSFKVRICFEEKFDFCIYHKVAQKRDGEPVTSSVLYFPRIEVSPNTTGWKSK